MFLIDIVKILFHPVRFPDLSAETQPDCKTSLQGSILLLLSNQISDIRNSGLDEEKS